MGSFYYLFFEMRSFFIFFLKETLMEENDMPWVTCFYSIFSINAWLRTNSGTAFVDDFDQDLKLLIISMQEDMRFTWQCWSSKKSMEMTKKLRHCTNWIWPTTTTFQVKFPASLIICPGLKHWICTIIALLESYLCL
jgi:hypothetical protein